MDLAATLGQLHPVLQALVGTLFTWGVTAFGAATVFLSRQLSRKMLDWMLGFASGVMIAASYRSLLAPALEIAAEQEIPVWLPAVIGFLLGGVFLRGIDRILPYLHAAETKAEGMKTTWRRLEKTRRKWYGRSN